MRTFLILVLISLLLGACAPAVDVVALASTAQSIAATGVVATLRAMPTNTPLPSATFTATLEPTGTATAVVTQGATATSTNAQAVAQGTLISNLPTEVSATDKADKSDATSPLLLQNNSGQTVWLIIEAPVYLEYRFSDSMLILVPQGVYHYRAYIGENGPYEGTFSIGNQDKHTLIFSANKVTFQKP
jgi:hypothetical protein